MNPWETLVAGSDTDGERRLALILAATVLLVSGHVDGTVWIICAGYFVGGDVAHRLARTPMGRE